MLAEERIKQIRETALKLHELRQHTTGGVWKKEGSLLVRPDHGSDDIAQFGDSQLGPMNESPRHNRDYAVAVQNANVEAMLLDLLEERVGQGKLLSEANKLNLDLQDRNNPQQLADATKSILQRDQEIADLQSKLKESVERTAQQDRQLTSLEAKLEDRDRMIAELQEKLLEVETRPENTTRQVEKAAPGKNKR